MRITTQQGNSSSGADGKAFGFERTAEAFQLLSSTLYSNKPRAIIRELSCNALDAHIAAGRAEQPFEVKIPNSLDAQFHVKDYGPGLSHEDVLKLYTTYFKSTKQESDEFIGGFGVGSKSPFAYTDSFTVESRHGGTKRIYSAYLNDSGVPEMSMMFEVDSDEPTGLTVGFPVNSADFQVFEKEANDVLSVFPVKPTMQGMVLRERDMGAILLKTDKVEVRKPNRHSNTASLLVGAVEYPLTKYKEHIVNTKDSWLFEWLVSSNITIKVPVGTVSVAVSREDLSYDQKTLDALPVILKSATLEILKEISTSDVLPQHAVTDITSMFDTLRTGKGSLFTLFPGDDLKKARNLIVGLATYKDLPGVQMAYVDLSTLEYMKAVPKHRFGKPKEKYSLFDHTNIHKNSRTLAQHWDNLCTQAIKKDSSAFKCFYVYLPTSSTQERMLALDLIERHVTEDGHAVLLTPQANTAEKEFITEVHETLKRWDISGEDLTQAWKEARHEYYGPTLQNATLPTVSNGKRFLVKDWCVTINNEELHEDAFSRVARKIKMGVDHKNIKKKSFQALPAPHSRLQTEPVYYIEYDVKNDTYSGLKYQQMFHLLKTTFALDIPRRHIAIVPKDSPFLNNENWSDFKSEWVAAWTDNAHKYAMIFSKEAMAVAQLYAEISNYCGEAWKETPAAQLIASMPGFGADHRDATNNYYINLAKEALAEILPVSINESADPIVQKLKSDYPMLMAIARDNARHRLRITDEVAQHTLLYIEGQALLNSSNNLTV